MKKFVLLSCLTLGSKKYPHNAKEYAEGIDRHLYGGVDVAGGGCLVQKKKSPYGYVSASCAGGVEFCQAGLSVFGDLGKGLKDYGVHGLLNLSFSPVFCTVLCGASSKGLSGALKIGGNVHCFHASLLGQVKLPYKDLKKPIYTISVCLGVWGNLCPVGKWNAEEPLLREYDRIAGPKREDESDVDYNLRMASRKSNLKELWRTLPEDQKVEYGSMETSRSTAYSYSFSRGLRETSVSTWTTSWKFLDGNLCPKNLYRLRRIARYEAKKRK